MSWSAVYLLDRISQRNMLSFISISWKNSMLYHETKHHLLLISSCLRYFVNIPFRGGILRGTNWLYVKLYNFQRKQKNSMTFTNIDSEKFRYFFNVCRKNIAIFCVCVYSYVKPFFPKRTSSIFPGFNKKGSSKGILLLRDKRFTGLFSIVNNFDLLYIGMNKTWDNMTMTAHLRATVHANFKEICGVQQKQQEQELSMKSTVKKKQKLASIYCNKSYSEIWKAFCT